MTTPPPLMCDGCYQPIADSETRVYYGWRFTGTWSFPPHAGDTTHAYPLCQSAYVARGLASGRWARSQRWIAQDRGVSRHRVRRWLAGIPFDPRTGLTVKESA